VKNNYINNLPITNLYKQRNFNSKIDTQLLYGDSYKILKKYRGWNKVRIKKDGYIGYIKTIKLNKYIKPNFKVSSLKANLYKKPNQKSKLKKIIPFESRVRIKKKSKSFGRFGNYWIKYSDLKKINHKNKDIFKNVKLFKNIKYLWGGKTFKGIDCSALVQVFFNQNNRFCPRDSKDQEKFFKRKVKINNIKKNDLIFWEGHVAIALSKNKLIHAYGPKKKVVIMDIKRTIERIKRTANLNVTSVRRV